MKTSKPNLHLGYLDYSIWRNSHANELFFKEGHDSPDESLLQLIWFHQRLLRDRLTTLEGIPVKVLHPGFWNRESGPDFLMAVLQFGDESPVSGDVEIDRVPYGWKGHGHRQNPDYQKVRLRVVWEMVGSSLITDPPIMEMKPFLDDDVSDLAWALNGELGLPVEWKGNCHAPLSRLSPERLSSLLLQAARCRLVSKALRFQARARRVGWNQALWEGLFIGLGYKRNHWPFQRLGELLPGIQAVIPVSKLDGEIPVDHHAMEWQARLLGIGGLLPGDVEGLPDDSRHFVARLWDIWWREHSLWEPCRIPGDVWRMDHVRPTNHPTRRLAWVSHWLARGDFAAQVEGWLNGVDTKNALNSLSDMMRTPDGELFWRRHLSFQSRTLPGNTPLMGRERISDLGVNVILPWFWARTDLGKDEGLRQHVESLYFQWPSGGDNSTLRLARQRLGCELRKGGFQTAAEQQGLIQITRDFCQHSNSICQNCRFPGLVQNWCEGSGGT